MAGIPPPRDTDAEDVTWALQTAETQWKRNDREDALVWLRRAVLSAGEAHHDDRMIELARSAVELAEELEHGGDDEITAAGDSLLVDDADVESLPPSARAPALSGAPPVGTPAPPVGPTAASAPAPAPVAPAPAPVAPAPAPVAAPPAPVAPAPATPPSPAAPAAAAALAPARVPRELVRPAIRPLSTASQRAVRPERPELRRTVTEPTLARPQAPDPRRTISEPTLTRPDAHIGGFPPASAGPDPKTLSLPGGTAAALALRSRAQLAVPAGGPASPAGASGRAPADGPQTDRASRLPPFEPHAHATVITDPGEDEPTPVGRASAVPVLPEAPVPAAPPAPGSQPGSARPPGSVQPGSTRAPGSVSVKPPPGSAQPASIKPPGPASASVRPATGFAKHTSSPSGPLEETRPVPAVNQAEEVLAQLDSLSEHPANKEPNTPVHRSTHAPLAPKPVDLSEVEAFADLPDDARETFAAAAVQVHFKAGEEVAEFALAYVIDGAVDVASRTVPVTASHLSKGAVLRARGTPTHSEAIRLVCATNAATIAVWSDDAVQAAFRSCPWVEDDLRSAADHIQALVGMTMGPLGRRLDEWLRLQVSSLLAVRSLLEGEYVAEAGAPVPGIVVVGAGHLELVEGDNVVGTLRAGEFLFPDQVLGAGAAPYGARAGAGGALVMTGNRKVAQELMVTCPPLLEILAGM